MLRRLGSLLVPWGALVLTAAFAALDVGQVAGISAWGYLAFVSLAAFAVLLLVENHRLHSEPDRLKRLIAELTQLSTEGARLKEHPGAGPMVLSIGSSTPQDQEREEQHSAQRREYDSLRLEWSQKVRSKLVDGAPEYIAHWEAAKMDDRFGLLLEDIKELRGRV